MAIMPNARQFGEIRVKEINVLVISASTLTQFQAKDSAKIMPDDSVKLSLVSLPSTDQLFCKGRNMYGGH